METTTNTQPTHTNYLTFYRNSGGCRASYTPAETLAYIDSHPGDVTLILGVMRPGYLGREMVTEADLHRWVHEEEDAAMWAEIEDGERAAAEQGQLR